MGTKIRCQCSLDIRESRHHGYLLVFQFLYFECEWSLFKLTYSNSTVYIVGEDWEPTYKQNEIEAWIRVRVWLPDDFPNPLFSSAWLPVSVNDGNCLNSIVKNQMTGDGIVWKTVHV